MRGHTDLLRVLSYFQVFQSFSIHCSVFFWVSLILFVYGFQPHLAHQTDRYARPPLHFASRFGHQVCSFVCSSFIPTWFSTCSYHRLV
jgi:hypothetical protein